MTTPNGVPSQGVSRASAGSAAADAARQAAAGTASVINTDQDQAIDAAGDVAAQQRWAHALDVNEVSAKPPFGQ